MDFLSWLQLESSLRKVVMLHGTSMDHWAIIKEKGLDPFPSKRVWSDDPNAGFYDHSRISYGGVYLTANILTALSSAHKYKNGNILLLALEVDPRTLVADEDQVSFAVSTVETGGMPGENSLAILYISHKCLQDPEYVRYWNYKYPSRLREERDNVEKLKETYVRNATTSLLKKINSDHPVLKRQIEDLLRNRGWVVALNRMAAYVSESTRDYFSSYKDPVKKIEWPSAAKAEKDFQDFVDKLTRLMKKAADPEVYEGLLKNARSLKPITFEGRNKIIYAAEIIKIPYKTYFGSDSTKEVPKRLYGEPPVELIREWEERMGEWEEQ